MRVYVVIPLSRPENLDNIVANFARQDHADKRLVIVENGRAVGACEARGVRPDILLTSAQHQSHAKNEALAAIRRRGGGRWTVFDDDDWYGRGHIAELAACADLATVVGRHMHFVRLSDGVHLFQPERANSPAESVNGATVFCHSSDAAEFPVVKFGEDVAWCRAMLAAGATFYAAGYRHFVYNRTVASHAWKASDLTVRMCFGRSLWFGHILDEDTDHVPLSAGVPVAAPSDGEIFSEMIQRCA